MPNKEVYGNVFNEEDRDAERRESRRTHGRMWKGSYATFPYRFAPAVLNGLYSRLAPLNAMNRHESTQSEPVAPKRRPKREKDLRVPVLVEEAAAIQDNARAVGLTVAAFLRAVGAGYQPRSVVDRDQVDAMLKVNGDLGRLGGLLKLWLSDDAKLKQFDRGQVRAAILSALRRIDENQTRLRVVIGRALRDRGEP